MFGVAQSGKLQAVGKTSKSLQQEISKVNETALQEKRELPGMGQWRMMWTEMGGAQEDCLAQERLHATGVVL